MRGDLDPMTLEPFEKAQQICSNAGTPVRAKPKRKVLVEISNKLTDYFEKVSSDNSVTIKMSKTETVEIKKEIKLKTRRRKRNGFQSELSLLEADKENKSAFLRAKRLSTRRNFGGINFKVELLEENK
ncbi:hypothetical protein MHBO_003045 [Bonamia ostreae]|uniref:Uncharacterized protein n=1 Tax=Bonamia ostreae TaxID=126728 RepID=A0ABV2APQ8_9EUKA